MIRDFRVDTIRGLMLVLMTIVHLSGPAAGFIYEAVGYVSEAEWFVFLSGLVAGLTYSRYADRSGEPAVWRKAFQRAATVYAFHVATFLVLLFLLPHLTLDQWGAQSWSPYWSQSLGMNLFLGLTFLAQPRFLDILPMYVVFLLTLPVMIGLLRRGKSGWLLLGSFVIWSFGQAGLREEIHGLLPSEWGVQLGAFDPFAWQLLFVLGVTAGFVMWRDRDAGKTVEASRPQVLQSPFLVATSATLVIICFLLRRGWLGDFSEMPDWYLLVQKSRMAPLRVMNFLALTTLVYWASARFWTKPGLNPLTYLGQHSLQVFSFHILVVYLAVHFFQNSSQSMNAYLLTLASSVLALFIPAAMNTVWRRWLERGRKHEAGSPASAGVVREPSLTTDPHG